VTWFWLGLAGWLLGQAAGFAWHGWSGRPLDDRTVLWTILWPIQAIGVALALPFALAYAAGERLRARRSVVLEGPDEK